MNYKKRSLTVLLVLFFFITISKGIFAQSPGGLKLEQLIRVDAQPFMTQGRLCHGYFVFRCKIQNLDVKPHKIALSCNNVASKSFELQAGETINASLPLPVTSPSFGNDIQVYSDNRLLNAIPRPMIKNLNTFSSSKYGYGRFSSYGHHKPDPDLLENNAVLVCRSLRKQFVEADCIFAEKDCKNWPQDRMDYSCLDFIILTPSELSAAPEGVQTALKQFVLSGGILWLFDSEEQKESLDKIGWIAQLKNEMNPPFDHNSRVHCLKYPVAFGCVILSNFSPESFHNNYFNNQPGKLIIQDIYDYFDLRSYFDVHWFERNDLNDIQKWFPVVKDLSIPIMGINVVILLFVLLAGPINLFILTKHNKRILLLITVPVLSFLFASAILLYVVLSDGFNTESRSAAVVNLDQRNGIYSSLCQYGVYARTSPRNVVFDSNDELNISDISEDERLNIDWTSGKQVIHSRFAQVRKPAYYKIRKTGTTRLKLDFDFNETNPYVVNGLGKDVDQLFVRDAEGNLWKAEKIRAGQKATLSAVNKQYDEKRSNDVKLSTCISTSRWNFNEHSVNIQNDVDVLRPGSYIATFSSSGPFANKGISYAKEKESFTLLTGRF